MRSLSIRMLIALSILLVPTFVYADVTISGTTSFASLDGGPDDADHTVNGVFTVNGNLIVNGTINCNDTGGSSSACPMSFNVSGDMTINAGGALYAENRTGSGTGGAITISVGGNFVMHGVAGTSAAAVISSDAKNSSASNGGAITVSVTGTVSIENGATIDAGAVNAAGGKVTLLAGGHIDISGNIVSGPSRTLLSTVHTGQALDGGTSNQSGGEIYIQGTSYSEPGVTIGSTANIISQGQTNGAGPVTIEGCGVVVKGLVAALAMKDYNARVDIRSGKAVTVDARDLGVANATLGRNGQIRVDAPTGAAGHHTLDIYAGTAITISGPDPSASSLFALSGLPGVNTSKSDGATMHIMAVGGVLTGSVTASGNIIDAGRVTSGDGGGHIEVSAQGDVNLDTARILAIGDSNTNNTNRNGGSIAVRSYSGNVIWTNGIGDVTPTGSDVPTLQRGSISLTACGTINTSGSTFPTNGSPVGTFPATTTGTCSPATPSLPVTEPALPVCNNPPVADNISATTNEDNAVTITMTASDIDGDSITFTIATPPSHGTLGAIFNPTPTSAQVTYTPDANYNGTDSFTFQADDGKGGTSIGTVTITINPVNDPPTFNLGANPVTSNEDAGPQSIANYASSISPGPTPDEQTQTVTFTVTNDNNALFSAQPAISSNGTLTYTSAPNANGSANVVVVAHDNGGTANGGNDTSGPQNFNIIVNAVNDAPSFTKGADQTVLEDAGAQTVSGWATGISAGPPDESSQTVTFNVSNNNNALFSAQPAVAPNGTLTFTSAPNANGVATVTVTAHDNGGTANGGVDTSAPQTFTITVIAVNDPPSFTKGADQTVLEDSGAHTVTGWATSISAGPPDESSQTVTFNVSNDNNALFSAQPAVASDGTLTFTSAPDANGTATVTIAAHDDGGTANGGVDTSASQTFTITVTAVNDAPSFMKGADQTVLEDAGPQTVAGWATSISAGPANESSQTVNFIVSNDNNGLFSVQPAVSATGTLTYTPAANANGTATVTVAIHDDGGTANGGVDTSANQTFTITVTAVNDAPSFTKGADQTVLEDSGPHTVTGWATAISPGPADESSQTVSFTTTNDNNALFSAQPSVDASGNLTFTSAPDANGTATVSVTAHDNGGTANGGVDTSAAQTFTITVTAVNDAPSFTKGSDESVMSDAGPQTYNAWATNISAGPANESSQTVSFIVNNDNNAVFTAQPAVSSTGTLTFTTAVAAPTTTVHVTVAAHDNGGTANGGVDTSAPQTFNINVTHANQPPVANPDSFDAIGNTELAVGTSGTQAATLSVATGSVLANDTDPENDPLTATLGTVTAGASVTMNSDGTFTYLPPAGFTGDDSFTYVVNDGHGHNVTGTVTIHVSKRVLYVKNNGGGSTGRVDSPYATLAAAQAASADNDTVYVFNGDGTNSGQNAGFALNHNGERLIGEGVALTASGTYNSVSNPQLRAAGTAPQLSNAGGNGVTIAKVGTLATAEVSGVNITSASGHGVQITDATDVTMNSDTMSAVTGSGVKGTKVVNYSLTNSTITGAGGSGLAFDNATGTENNLAGTVTITGDNITTPAQHGIDILNFDGTISSITISGNTIVSPTTTATSSGSGIRLIANGNVTTVAKVVSGSITNNTIRNFPSGAGILVQGSAALGGPSTQMGTAGSGSDVITITGNTIAGLSTAVRMGTQAINVSVNSAGTGNFVISNNGTVASPLANTFGVGIAAAAFGNTTVTATINNNVLTPHNSVGNGGIVVGVDQSAASTDAPNMTATIIGNTISFTDGNGILTTARNSTGTLTVKIQNNTVAAPLSGVRQGIRVDSGNTIGNASVCLNISGNTSAGSGGTNGIGLRKQGTSSSVNVFGIDGMAATSSPGVEAYVNGLNPNGGGTLLLSATSGFTNCSNP